jgi:hypothetical protein
MLLEAARNRPSLDVMVSNTLRANPLLPKRIYEDKPSATAYGLDKYTSNKLEPDPVTRADDLYVERGKNGVVISFLRCPPPGKVKIPSCSHKFIDKGLLYQIHWKISSENTS